MSASDQMRAMLDQRMGTARNGELASERANQNFYNLLKKFALQIYLENFMSIYGGGGGG